MKAFLCIKHRGISDILKNFLNMLVYHKINEAEWWKKPVQLCQGSVCCQDTVIRKRIQLWSNT